ncbi:MAG: transcription-repair coupling factor [Flavobacteriales bacterium]|nr:transcription-repair coupling factor [Flavobacteriales bacterium]
MDLFSKGETSIFQVFDDKEKALYALNEVEEIFGKESVLFFPHSYLKPYEVEEVKNANVVLRSEVLNKLRNGKKKYFVVSYSDAIVGKVTTKKELKSHLHTISVGEEIDTEFLNELLFSFGFHRTDFVTQPGEFSLRGGIVDVFSFSNEKPYRLVFFGNEVEEIKEFDIETQLSEKKEKKVVILPNLDIGTNTSSNKESIFSYLKEDSLVVLNDSTNISRKIEENYYLAERIFQELNSTIKRNLPKDLYLTKDDFQELKNSFLIVDDSKISYQTPDLEFELSLKQQPNFAKNFEVLTENLKENREKGIKNYIVFQTKKQEERLCEIIQDLSSENLFTSIQAKLYEGFIDTESNCAVYTDHHIFERYLKFNDRTSFSKSQQLVIKELTDLKVGDFVTHIDYGIGKFLGLKKIDVNGKPQEAIKMSFLNDDILYVSVHSLHKISRYTSKDGTAPKLNKLGSPAWKNLKNKTKKRVKEVAFDLIKLYAKRKSIQGYSFSEDSYLQTELEASFQYEDTPDQEKATIDFKKDMESNIPMDRLVCGDVGFGKTEIAIRAAFKAVGDSKQVAILVPTTILAFQHYKTFSKRLNDFPVKIDYLNRFRSAKQKSQIIQELSEGKIDIIIGTHQLISQKIKFKDLGLLIVDEEHKFGVSVKDKLKTLRANLDTLTLTATPIPRTLQFSLMSARDLSIIKTPPPNRQPVDTILSTFNEETIRDAISYEMARDGQVFFINNRIENLPQIANLIQRLVPEAKIAIGHGQMEGKKIEDILLNFMEGNYDVLISTTIVESGLDVPNANTILINDAQRFGMADLHQMRGRVGRSNRKAFCYLLSPPFDTLTQEAQKRLQALEIFSDLGSGFQIAMKDLEIRGAGDLLGAEQSGFISDIGFDTYQKILNEAIEELKQNDFSDLFEEEETEYVKDVQIDTDLNVLIPDTYINKVEERFSFYQRLSKVENEKELTEIKQELKDRFGDFPKECTDLFTSVEIKWVCKKIGFERLIIKKNTLLAYFPESSSKFFESEKFTSFLMFIQKHPELGILKEKTTKEGKFLVFRKEEIKSLNDLKAELINYAEILN